MTFTEKSKVIIAKLSKSELIELLNSADLRNCHDGRKKVYIKIINQELKSRSKPEKKQIGTYTINKKGIALRKGEKK